MIEVFKTNVENSNEADLLIKNIERMFSDYKVNFDLEDCDRIMRVKSRTGGINSENLIKLLNLSGFNASVLDDEIVSI